MNQENARSGRGGFILFFCDRIDCSTTSRFEKLGTKLYDLTLHTLSYRGQYGVS